MNLNCHENDLQFLQIMSRFLQSQDFALSSLPLRQFVGHSFTMQIQQDVHELIQKLFEKSSLVHSWIRIRNKIQRKCRLCEYNKYLLFSYFLERTLNIIVWDRAYKFEKDTYIIVRNVRLTEFLNNNQFIVDGLSEAIVRQDDENVLLE